MKKLYTILLIIFYIIPSSSDKIQSMNIKDNAFYLKNRLDVITKTEFLHKTAYLESTHCWDCANKYGYVGKYQLGRSAMLDLGYDTVYIDSIQSSIYKDSNSVYKFDTLIFNKKQQLEAIHKFITKNEKVYLKSHISRYVGKEIDGIRITKAGILGASFLGFNKVKKFLNSNGKINPKDKNGHSVKYRLKYFENFEI